MNYDPFKPGAKSFSQQVRTVGGIAFVFATAGAIVAANFLKNKIYK